MATGAGLSEKAPPSQPLVEAWFSSPEGYYSLADSPANATCQVRAGLCWCLSLCSGPQLVPQLSSAACGHVSFGRAPRLHSRLLWPTELLTEKVIKC